MRTKFTGFYHQSVTWSCGLEVLGGFQQNTHSQTRNLETSNLVSNLGMGTGFFIASFIECDSSKQAYEVLTAKYPVVYQSPVRNNNNSQNDFFFCVFDAKGEEKGLDKVPFPAMELGEDEY